MSEEQIEIILKEVQKLLKVDQYSKVEFKRKKFKSLLHWLAYKVGLHCCCYDLSKNMINTPISYLEVTKDYFLKYIFPKEHVLWTCAAFSDKMDEEKIRLKFENFADKYFGSAYQDPSEILEAFLKKMIPNLTKGVILFNDL